MKEQKILKSIRWTARIWGTLLLVFILYLVLQEYFEELQPGISAKAALISLFSSMKGVLTEWIICCMAMTGLVLAFWKEGIGGAISLICFIVLYFMLGPPDHTIN